MLMEEVHCEKCGFSWRSPTALDKAVQDEVAYLIRNGNRIDAHRRLRTATGMGLYDAKNVEIHVTRERGRCQQCGSALPPGGVVACGRCRSLNYDW
jgi:hypothetical protein